MFLKIAVITFVCMSVGMAQERCALLQGLYESFQCRALCNGTKYSCADSPYKQLYRMDQCFHDGVYYTNNQATPLLHFGTSQLCEYRCFVSGFGLFGPVFFLTANCNPTDTEPESVCFDLTLSVPDFFYFNFIPVFRPNDVCPYRWISSNFPTVQSDDCSSSPRSCCVFPGATLQIGRTFTAGANVACSCQCPPYAQCIETL